MEALTKGASWLGAIGLPIRGAWTSHKSHEQEGAWQKSKAIGALMKAQARGTSWKTWKKEHHGFRAIGPLTKRSKRSIMVLEQLDCWEAQVRKTSQLKTNALLGSISKRCIMTLIVFQENMNKRSKTSLAWSKKSMKEEELMTFARGDDHRGWKRGYGEIFFPKVEASYLYNKCSKWNMCSKYNFWQLVFLIH